jgi:cell division initiation protein
MDLSAKVLREVEFRDRLRGYDTDEVDEFLEKVAIAVDETQEKMRQLAYRAERAERSVSERAADEDEDSIRRTLVLAQRTADLAVREAQEQAAALMDAARSEAEKLLGDARASAHRLAAESERRHRDEIARLETQRDQAKGELTSLSGMLEAERKRLSEALSAALRFVERTMTPAAEVAEIRPVTAPGAGRVPDDIESQINEDAAAAAPSPAPADTGADRQVSGSSSEVGRTSLAAVPPLPDSGPDTEAWQPEHVTAMGRQDAEIMSAKVDAGSRNSRKSDWIA